MKSINSKSIIPAIILLSAIYGISFSCSNEKAKKGEKTVTSKAKIKSIRETEFKAIDKFGETQKGDIQRVIITHGKQNGNKSDRSYYDPDGSLNEKGIYEYDEKGNIYAVNVYNSAGNLEYRFLFKDDEKGNVVEMDKLNPNNDLMSKEIIRNDDKGNEIERNIYNSEGKLENKIITEYDDKNYELEQRAYDKNGKLVESATYKYEKYDKEGNWLIKITKGTDFLVTERGIEYYE